MPAKVGFILKGYPRLSETFIAQEMQLLESRGLELEIYSMRGPRETERHPVHGQIRAQVTYLPEYLSSGMVAPNLRAFRAFPVGYALGLAHALKNSLRRRKKSPLKRFLQAGWLIDAKSIGKKGGVGHLHSHFLHAPTELALSLAKITGLTYSISAHAKDIYTSTAEEVRERVKGAQFLMTCTKFNFEKIRAIVGPAHAAKVNEVYHGVNLEAFRPSDAKRALLPVPRLLTVARLVEKKGYDDVFRAMEILNHEGLRLVYDLYGAGEMRAQLEGLAAKLGLGKQVRFHGAVTQPQVIEAYRAGGVFVLGSFETANGDRDGIPNSMAEAMSMELPVVATKVSGIPELIEDGITGLL
ncbi:MAG: colanic acid biosynthesis glycosyltransferase WcaL, partial [Proteobacteria bacterium]